MTEPFLTSDVKQYEPTRDGPEMFAYQLMTTTPPPKPLQPVDLGYQLSSGPNEQNWKKFVVSAVLVCLGPPMAVTAVTLKAINFRPLWAPSLALLSALCGFTAMLFAASMLPCRARPSLYCLAAAEFAAAVLAMAFVVI